MTIVLDGLFGVLKVVIYFESLWSTSKNMKNIAHTYLPNKKLSWFKGCHDI